MSIQYKDKTKKTLPITKEDIQTKIKTDSHPSINQIKNYPIKEEILKHDPDLEFKSNKTFCPFHEDKKTRSFSINKKDNYWHCFGCKKGGDIFNFLKYKGISFEDALQLYGHSYKKIPLNDYLQLYRKINTDTIKRYKIHTYDQKRYIYFPITQEKGVKHYPFNDNRYINSKGFKKTEHLFGLEQAKEEIIKQKEVIIVEGLFDVLTMHQRGIKNVVGTFGASLSDKQIKQLKLLISKVILIYDADDAGKSGTSKAIPELQAAGIEVKIYQLPEGTDPDEHFKINEWDDALITTIKKYLENKGKDLNKQADIDFEIQNFSQVKTKACQWAWHGMLVKGNLNFICGPGESGKSTLAYSIITTEVQGKDFPILNKTNREVTGTKGSKGAVLYIGDDESVEEVAKPTLAEKLDQKELEKVHCIPYRIKGKTKQEFSLAKDIPELLKWLETNNPDLLKNLSTIVIDPLTPIATSVKDKSDTLAVRECIQPLKEFAQKHNITIIGIAHTPKGHKTRDLDEMLIGSVAWKDNVRSVIGVIKCVKPDYENQSLVIRVKVNRSIKTDGFLMSRKIIEGGEKKDDYGNKMEDFVITDITDNNYFKIVKGESNSLRKEYCIEREIKNNQQNQNNKTKKCFQRIITILNHQKNSKLTQQEIWGKDQCLAGENFSDILGKDSNYRKSTYKDTFTKHTDPNTNTEYYLKQHDAEHQKDKKQPIKYSLISKKTLRECFEYIKITLKNKSTQMERNELSQICHNKKFPEQYIEEAFKKLDLDKEAEKEIKEGNTYYQLK